MRALPLSPKHRHSTRPPSEPREMKQTSIRSLPFQCFLQNWPCNQHFNHFSLNCIKAFSAGCGRPLLAACVVRLLDMHIRMRTTAWELHLVLHLASHMGQDFVGGESWLQNCWQGFLFCFFSKPFRIRRKCLLWQSWGYCLHFHCVSFSWNVIITMCYFDLELKATMGYSGHPRDNQKWC